MSDNTAINPNRKRKSLDAATAAAAEESADAVPRERRGEERRDGPEGGATTLCSRCRRSVPVTNGIVHEAICARRGAPSGGGPVRRSPPPARDGSAADPRRSDEASPTDARPESSARSNSDGDVVPAASVASGGVRPPPRSRPDSSDAVTSRERVSQPCSLSYRDVPSPRTETIADRSTVAGGPSNVNDTAQAVTTTAHAATETEADWSCPRCTLINPSSMPYCDACLYRRHRPDIPHMSGFNPSVRPPDATRRDRLLGDPFVSDVMQQDDAARGWVNVSRPDASNPITTNNPTTHNNNSTTQQQRLTTGYRIFNSALNGAMIGSIFGGIGGMLFGGIAGGLGGAYVSNFRNRQEAEGRREVEEVLRDVDGWDGSANLGNDGAGGRRAVRVHRGRNHLIAVSSDGNGGNSILRLRYGAGAGNGRGRAAAGAGAGGAVDRAENAEIMEQALADLLLRMSYMHGLGPPRYGNILIQPDFTYEELLERYGFGNENRRGAGQEVIDSYPVVVVGRDVEVSKQSIAKVKEEEESTKPSAVAEPTTEKAIDYGTCNICLEDYQNGDHLKSLSCPHSFHKECIDKWLKQVASCPICKKEVEMFKEQKDGDKKPSAVTGT